MVLTLFRTLLTKPLPQQQQTKLDMTTYTTPVETTEIEAYLKPLRTGLTGLNNIQVVVEQQ